MLINSDDYCSTWSNHMEFLSSKATELVERWNLNRKTSWGLKLLNNHAMPKSVKSVKPTKTNNGSSIGWTWKMSLFSKISGYYYCLVNKPLDYGKSKKINRPFSISINKIGTRLKTIIVNKYEIQMFRWWSDL